MSNLKSRWEEYWYNVKWRRWYKRRNRPYREPDHYYPGKGGHDAAKFQFVVFLIFIGAALVWALVKMVLNIR